MSLAGSVLTLSSRGVDEGVCDGKKKRTLEEALRSTAFLSDGGGVASSPFIFCIVCDIKEGPGICCMVVVPLFSPALLISR